MKPKTKTYPQAEALERDQFSYNLEPFTKVLRQFVYMQDRHNTHHHVVHLEEEQRKELRRRGCEVKKVGNILDNLYYVYHPDLIIHLIYRPGTHPYDEARTKEKVFTFIHIKDLTIEA